MASALLLAKRTLLEKLPLKRSTSSQLPLPPTVALSATSKFRSSLASTIPILSRPCQSSLLRATAHSGLHVSDRLNKDLPPIPVVETHASLGAHIPISVHPSSFALLSTATRTQPARELSDAQLGTSDRVLRRSRMSGYSLPLPVSVAITRISFRSVWTSSRYSAQPPAPNPHESSPMRSLVHLIGSCEGPA